MNRLRWLLSTQLKTYQNQKQNGGFTLIELLVAVLLAFLVITPLMGFMISVLDTDRQEQAKVNSEQEVKAALDYIARDLQQSLYIYDDTGIAAIQTKIPSVTNGVPILVFWKREFTNEAVQVKNSAGVVQFRDDSFVYSLVAYYLIKDNQSPWSRAARIARWQIKDGVTNTTGSDCTGFPTTEKYSLCPDKGFKPFNLSQKGLTLEAKMNSWTNSLASGETYNQNTTVLVDFIDQTTKAQGAPVTCSTGFRQVPATTTADSSFRTGFYACVDSVTSENRSAVEVYLRGNAQARLTQDDAKMIYNTNKSSYFPTGNIKVQGQSFVFTK
jgi:type II secretory pathway pseudopilin PulG